MKIHTELNRIQKELKVPKSQRNTFGNYNYRNAEDILEAYKGVAGNTTLIINDEIVMIGNRYYVRATATLSLDTETITSQSFAREAEEKKGMDVSQITGATSSYARKYALNALFAIDDTKDADSHDNTVKTETKKEITDVLRKQVEDCTTLEALQKIYKANEGLGKEFAKIVTEQKTFIQKANADIV